MLYAEGRGAEQACELFEVDTVCIFVAAIDEEVRRTEGKNVRMDASRCTTALSMQ